jgi:hypothetical protein
MPHPARLCATGLLSALALLAVPSRAAACSCIAGIPICQTFWRTPAVFSALVLEVQRDADAAPRTLTNRTVKLQVEQTWRGGVSGIVEARTGSGGGDCGYDFTPGVRYLVYAERQGDGLSVYSCNRTRPLADASEDLAYLAKAFEPAAAGRIYGTVQYQRTGGDQPERPISGYTVMLRARGQEWKTTTNAVGHYEFRVPAGKYAIHVDVPATEHAYGRREVELFDPRGCAREDFYVAADGRIATRIVAPQGDALITVTSETDASRGGRVSTRTRTGP